MKSIYICVVEMVLCWMLSPSFSQDAYLLNPPTITLVSSKDSFREDHRTQFVCEVQGANTGLTGHWYLRDPQSRLELFYTFNIRVKTLGETFKNGKLHLALVMRRDFSRKELVCRTSKGEEAAYRLPAITETIPIKSVRFLPTQYVANATYRVRCEVTSPPGWVKVAQLRSRLEVIEAQKEIRKSPTVTIYEWSDKKSAEQLDGSLMQCIAVTRDIYSEEGHVNSDLIQLSLPYLEPISRRMEVRKEETVNLLFAFKSKIIPQPKNFDFQVTAANLSHIVRGNFTLSHKRTHLKDVFEVKGRLTPKYSCAVSLRCHSPVFITKSDRVIIRVSHFSFSSNFSKTHVTKGNSAVVKTNVASTPPPQPLSFHLFRLENISLGRVDRRRSFIEAVNISAINSRADFYRVSVFIRPQKSGLYQLYYSSPIAAARSPTFRIQLHTQPTEKTFSIVFLIVILSVVAIVAFLLGIGLGTITSKILGTRSNSKRGNEATDAAHEDIRDIETK